MIGKEKYDNGGEVWLLRHAEKENVTNGEFGNEVSLTERGRCQSLSFGAQIRHLPIKKIMCSPLPRCVQTATLIKNGGHLTIGIEYSSLLGDPGLHIQDARLAGDLFLQHSPQEIYRMFANGKPLLGITNKDALKSAALLFIQQNIPQDGIILCITHDTLIAHIACALNIYDYSIEWVKYLDGIKINNNMIKHATI